MSLNDVYTISQILASVAVVASLVFVGQQVRQANHMMRAEAMRNHADKFQSVSRAMFEIPGMAPLIAKGFDGMGAFDAVERMQFINIIMWILRIAEELHLQFEAGLIERDLWDANCRIWVRTFQGKGPREAFELRRELFTPKFQAFFDDLVSRPDGKSLY